MSRVDWALAELRRGRRRGRGRGVLLPCVEPPAGTSPANPVWDDFWRVLEESGTPAIHIGAGGLASREDDDPMFPPCVFGDVPRLRAEFPDRPGGEEQLGPFYIVVHLAAEVYLTCLVMGGVFERFPDLRFGVIEFGVAWLGPLCERLDAHAELLHKVGVSYPLRPSEYVRRNVRVTPRWSERSTCSSSGTGCASRTCSAPTTRTSRAAATPSRASPRWPPGSARPTPRSSSSPTASCSSRSLLPVTEATTHLEAANLEPGNLVLERDGSVLWIRLNRPESRNMIDTATRVELADAFAAADDDHDVRADRRDRIRPRLLHRRGLHRAGWRRRRRGRAEPARLRPRHCVPSRICSARTGSSRPPS